MNEQDQQGSQWGDGGYASERYESIGSGNQHPQVADDQPTYAAPYESAPYQGGQPYQSGQQNHASYQSGQSYPSGHPSNAPYAQPYASQTSAPQQHPGDLPYAHGAAPMPEPERRGGRGWIVALVLALTAVASFALVTLLMQKKSNNHDAMAPNTVATAPSTASGSPTGSASPTSSASSATVANFPADASLQCTEDDGSGNYVLSDNTDAENVRMKNGAKTSCGFLGATRNEVVAKLAADRNATSFTVTPYSAALKKAITLNCSVANGLTYCEGGTSAKMWVRNP